MSNDDSAARGYPRRKRLRLAGYDYSLPGAYFVTICTEGMRTLFGAVREGVVELNSIGSMAEETWLELPVSYQGVVLDAHVVIPNHVHGIIGLVDPTAAHKAAVGADPRVRPRRALGLSELIQRYKSLTTNRCHALKESTGAMHLPTRLWQRSFWDRIIRDERELQSAREYIASNPRSWELERDQHSEWIPSAE